MRRRFGIGIGLGVSLLVHALVVGGMGWIHGWRDEKEPVLPVELVETPAPTPPATPPKPPAPPPQPAAPPKPVAAKPKPRPKPKPVVVEEVVLPSDGGVPDAEEVAEAGPDAGPDAGPPAAATAALDLRPFVPGGARLMLVLRTDRLRGSPWSAALDQVLSPMPDYRTIILGSGLGLVDTFDTIVIATPDARDVTATFLAARSERDQAELQKALPGVTWTQAAGGPVGHPAVDPRVGDTRVLLVPTKGWMILTRPEHVQELLAPSGTPDPPAWVERLTHVVDETGAGADGPIAVLGLADVGDTVPLLDGAPAPLRGTLTVTAVPDGMVVDGLLVFTDSGTAGRFVAAAEAKRREANGSIMSRGLLRTTHTYALVQSLTFTLEGEQARVHAVLPAADATVLLESAAGWSRDYFGSRRLPPK